ncbi:DNA mismatch repair protein MutT [Aliidiomarina shirensis]|uniref:DNA mismatch repair protein MutT n=1 Tax=Aliidiomarina shirensis TaxID=1048642 RepID=A0A432WUP0_9GAMM|nr:NUDIX domain-containing protein [Aliidiomarina shirensis]RUO37486.1 DNA mismatch repair protein MutT [Aliidiomarina shirensis]
MTQFSLLDIRLISHLVHESLADYDLHASAPARDMRVLKREAARGIVRRDDKILLLYTERYDDFSFPGGGIDAGESPIVGLKRELQEETGAQDIQVLSPFGKVTEYMPTWKKDWDLMHQTSYWFHCDVAEELGASNLEHYEINNGMSAHWVSLAEAVAHNQKVIQQRPKTMGLSIHRETLVLEQLLAL